MSDEKRYYVSIVSDPHTPHAVELRCKASEVAAVEAWLERLARLRLTSATWVVGDDTGGENGAMDDTNETP